MRPLLSAAAFSIAAMLLVPSQAAPATIQSVGGVQVIVDGPAQPAAKPVAPHHKAKPTHAAAKAVAQESSDIPDASPRAAALIHYAMNFVGVPYVWGGTSPSGFDCSGFTYYVYGAMGVSIPRTADAQFAYGRPISGYPEPGDLVFFQTYDWGASHVGIYLGNGWFIQAIRPNVHLSNFNSDYFRSRYLGARRFFPA